ncbi:MAG: SOS response-associated peptidase [Cyclobacteriaceae bacterium]|jgi:putative SOS response-associated peptidase YedK|nr:SOS response-associated peptidase [Cyclobacteriaceae bacterium]
MIERYSISALPSDLETSFSTDVPDYYHPRFNAAPTQLLPVITSENPEGLSLFYWGRPASFAKNRSLSERIINLSLEHLLERPVLKKAMMKFRCIIPADGFYAWKKVGKKTAIPYRIITNKTLFAFAGLWEEFEDEGGEVVHTFSMVTTHSTESISKITDRMPVMFTQGQEKIWLSKTATEQQLLEVLRHAQPESMSYYPVSPRIHETKFDAPSLLIPTPPTNQFGNLTLFD